MYLVLYPARHYQSTAQSCYLTTLSQLYRLSGHVLF